MACCVEEGRAVPNEGAAGDDSRLEPLEAYQIAVAAIRDMRPSPITLAQVAGPVLAVAAPALPLLFLAFPAGEVLQQILKLVF